MGLILLFEADWQLCLFCSAWPAQNLPIFLGLSRCDVSWQPETTEIISLDLKQIFLMNLFVLLWIGLPKSAVRYQSLETFEWPLRLCQSTVLLDLPTYIEVKGTRSCLLSLTITYSCMRMCMLAWYRSTESRLSENGNPNHAQRWKRINLKQHMDPNIHLVMVVISVLCRPN